MEVPIFSKAPIKKFKMKKNEENVEEYTEVDTLSSQVYNKVAVGGESIKIADIDSKSYFAKMKDNWPESWKNTNNSCNEENKEITNSDSDLEENYNSENDNSDIIPDNLEETTEEEMLLDDITEIEKLRIVSDLEDDSVTFDNLQESFFNSNPFDSDDENEDDDFCEKQFIDNNDYEIKTSSSNIIFNDDDDDDDYWDFRKEMNEVFNNNECEKENIIERSDSIVNKNVSMKSEENNFSNNNKEPEVEENDFTSWKNTSESINTNDIKNFLNQNMESYSHFRESEKLKQNIQQPQSYFQNQNTEPANKTYNRESGLYHQAMQIRNNNHHPLPNGNLLRENTQRINPEEYKRAEAESAAILENTLAEFGIKAKVCDIIHGPVVTLFKIIPAPGIKLSKIEGLSDNLALRLAAQSIRIIAPIPGEKVVGIEVPNPKRELISFKEVINSESFANNSYQVPVGLGKDIYGKVVAIDVHKMPHILIAGATGAGKSVCVNGFLCSILFSRSPEDVKMILIDPKVVELQPYDGIPHLLTPVITDPKDAVNALKYLVYEMEERYKILGKIGVRSIVEYRKMVKEGKLSMSLMPFIICVVDEFADLMTTVGKEAEMLFARLTAKARAVGIHLVLATQRPSADVITGVIKSNVPARIAFQVISYQDSRIILDQKGAEKLLGQGDMLYLSPTQPHPVRLQGAFLDKEEVDLVVEHWKSLAEPEYIDIGEILGIEDEESFTGGSGGGDGVSNDPLYEEAVEVVLQTKKASASYLQRRLSIGYNRA
ncbi:MAG: DNA translocase FtsK, partial [Spirochaetales bacterium]|nr:DNA translocase FtsK [Spirochaetales bacterium]